MQGVFIHDSVATSPELIDEDKGLGGGVSCTNAGTLRLDSCVVATNLASRGGGGLALRGCAADIATSTVNNNTVDPAATGAVQGSAASTEYVLGGGGMFVSHNVADRAASRFVNVFQVTMAVNHARMGAGLYMISDEDSTVCAATPYLCAQDISTRSLVRLDAIWLGQGLTANSAPGFADKAHDV